MLNLSVHSVPPSKTSQRKGVSSQRARGKSPDSGLEPVGILASCPSVLLKVFAPLSESLPIVPDGNGGVLLRRDATVISCAESVCQSEQVGELGDADGLRDYIVFVNWVLVWAALSVADVIFKDEAVEPSSCAGGVLGAIIKGA